MNKRFIFISVLIWAIIALAASFPTGNFFPNSSNNSLTRSSGRKSEVVNIHTDQTSVSDDSPELPKNNSDTGRHRTRFLLSRQLDINAIITTTAQLPGVISAHVKQLYVKYVTRKASLPGYYGFLFRLSPF